MAGLIGLESALSWPYSRSSCCKDTGGLSCHSAPQTPLACHTGMPLVSEACQIPFLPPLENPVPFSALQGSDS